MAQSNAWYMWVNAVSQLPPLLPLMLVIHRTLFFTTIFVVSESDIMLPTPSGAC